MGEARHFKFRALRLTSASVYTVDYLQRSKGDVWGHVNSLNFGK